MEISKKADAKIRNLVGMLLFRREFNRWLKEITPSWEWDWPHLVFIQNQIERVYAGLSLRLLLTMPPRHGKSEMATIRQAAWRIERDPKTKVIIAAYNQQLANRFSRRVRRIVEQRVSLASDATSIEDWETRAGGGCRAVGVGAGVTGHGADLIIVDDPTKSREEANSQSYRDRVHEWYSDDLYTRLEPGGAVMVIATRWHEDDLIGRLLAGDDGSNWKLINLPALAEDDDPLGRKPGEALCPARYDEAALRDRQRVLGNSFHALYQGRPVPLSGEMFQRAWFEDVVLKVPDHADRVRFWDKAGSAGRGDYTVGVLMAKADGMFFVEDVVRGQWSAYEREKRIRQAAERDEALGSVDIWMEQEPGSGGKDSASASIAGLAGYVAHAETATGDKITRSEPFAAQCEARNVKLVRGFWNQAYLDELCSFPFGVHDDQIDASSGAFNKLAKPMLEFACA